MSAEELRCGVAVDVNMNDKLDVAELAAFKKCLVAAPKLPSASDFLDFDGDGKVSWRRSSC